MSNLHNQVSKTDCQKIANSLVEKDLVTSKLYGKQAIYVARQDTIDTASPEQLAAVDREIAELQNKIGDHKTRNKQLSSGECCLQNQVNPCSFTTGFMVLMSTTLFSHRTEPAQLCNDDGANFRETELAGRQGIEGTLTTSAMIERLSKTN